jgi:hypothetical protein
MHARRSAKRFICYLPRVLRNPLDLSVRRKDYRGLKYC